MLPVAVSCAWHIASHRTGCGLKFDFVLRVVVSCCIALSCGTVLLSCADEEDGASIEMAFSKKRVEDRKRWLSAFRPGTYLDQSVDAIRYRDFVHKVCDAVNSHC
jgi:C-terminal associated domain of TOPRIM